MNEIVVPSCGNLNNTEWASRFIYKLNKSIHVLFKLVNRERKESMEMEGESERRRDRV